MIIRMEQKEMNLNYEKYKCINHRPLKLEYSFMSHINNTCNIACTVDETKLLLSPFARQCQNPCSGPSAVYQDLSTHHDGPVKKAIVDLPIQMKGNSKRSSGNLLGSFSNDDGQGSKNGKKAIGLISKTTTLNMHHTFLYISLPSLHNYNMNMPNFTIYGECKQATTNFPFSF